MMIRNPVVSGQFYPDKKEDLENMIKSCFDHKFGSKSQRKTQEGKVYGIISPHAGYMYSGPTASHSFSSISSQNPELVIIIGPNHFGIGEDAAAMNDVKWETPLGLVEVDSESSEKVVQKSKIVTIDSFSHSRDHSLEVQVPMLQYVLENEFRILPIILRSQNKETAIDVGNSITEIAREKNAIIIGSSDFTHYEENSFAYSQDKALIEPILEMNIDKFYSVLKDKQVTACGFGAIASTMVACKNLGATRGEILSYATSGDISGDKSSVVGYAAIQFV